MSELEKQPAPEEQSPSTPPLEAPPQPRRWPRLQGCLRTTWGRALLVAGVLGSAWGFYNTGVELYGMWRQSFVELHAIASPQDFKALPFSVKNPSSIFTFSDLQWYCRIIKIETENPSDHIDNNNIFVGSREKPITIAPGDPPVNIFCPLLAPFVPPAIRQIKFVTATANVHYKLALFGLQLWTQRVPMDFLWKEGNGWIEGTIYQ